MPAAAVAVAAACASGGPGFNELGANALFDRAVTEYRDEEWEAAIRTFEHLTLTFPGHARVQEARYLLADSYFSNDEYITAASEFARLADDYPTGEFADDARFKTCVSYFELSPVVQRDQEYTRVAIDHCRSLIGYFPNSEHVTRAQEIVDELTAKLAEKLLSVGEFYYAREAWDSAIVYYQDVVAQYPFAEVAPRALLRLVQTYETIGYADEAQTARERLLSEYPDSPEAEEVREGSLANRP